MISASPRWIPLLSWYISAMGMVFIDRKDKSRALDRMKKMTALLKDGASFVTFPEGSRSRDSQIQRFKSGALLAALEAQVQVVPVAIEGADRVIPPDTPECRPGVVRIVVGTPISVENLSSANRRAFADRVEQQVRT